MSISFTLPDTRPYPETPVKNNLLLNASSLAHTSSAAQRKLAAESLQTEIRGMLQQNYYLGFSVAMSMAADSESYRVLLDSLNQVLNAENDDEIQWFAMPLVLVAGCNQAQSMSLTAPVAALNACFENYPHLRALNQASWLPFLVSSTELSDINAGQWFQAKQNLEAAQQFAAGFKPSELSLPSGQSVHVVFALGYGDSKTQAALGQNLLKAGLPLMQLWQEALNTDGVTLFVNPLSPTTPLRALTEGSHMRQRMAMDVFSTNAIRAIRLQSPRVGVAAAAQQGGKLLFSFNATDSAFELAPQVFNWVLSPTDNIAVIQQNFLDLMAECRVEHLYMLKEALPEHADAPTYAQALKADGFNPFFSNGAVCK
ncbi:conjugal transfer protein [Neisseria animalis]|uniref:Conjugal transfer protein n=1 Tax=Neisseria animalis TaxID=492 RepID=A0A5P3MTL0_NEIAN|nr:conjugal transfer protein [Neisseria animalis]QEY24868.1 conjugal transfer protein [Neisseria animalis]ROW32398.1 conjugal transfer protein [Neisseria animalis]VEE08047.1 Uncharacterised protein [Neisseria animalis]